MQQADDALRALSHVARLAHGFLDVFQDASGPFIEDLAGRRQLDMARIAREQQRLHLALQLLDLPAQGRLRDVQFLRRARIAARIDNLDKVLELFERNQSYAFSRSVTA